MSARARFVRSLQHPRIEKLLRDPRVTGMLVRALKVRSQIDTTVDRRMEQIAHSLHLATKKEVRELRRTIRRLQHELDAARNEESND